MAKWVDIDELEGFSDEDRYQDADPFKAFCENLYVKASGPIEEDKHND